MIGPPSTPLRSATPARRRARDARERPTPRDLLSTFLAVLATVTTARGAAPDSSGLEFYFAFLPPLFEDDHVPPNEPSARLILTAEAPVDVTVEWPARSPAFSEIVAVVPGTATTVELPVAALRAWGEDRVQDRAVHLRGAEPFSVHAAALVRYVSDSALVLPVEGLGREYRTFSYRASHLGPAGSFNVVAVEDDTTVEILPSIDLGPHPAGEPYEVHLDAGEAYLGPELAHGADHTGTRIRACKPVSVATGGQCPFIPGAVQACDHLFEIAAPVRNWGRRFVLANPPDRPRGVVYRVLAALDGTDLELDGAPVGRIDADGWAQFHLLEGHHLLETSAPASVAQLLTGSFSPGATHGDPSLGVVQPIEQYLPAYTFSTVDHTWFFQQHAMLVVPDADVGTATLDGLVVPPAEFTPVAGSDHSVAVLEIDEGLHRSESPGGHGVAVLGYGIDVSYLHAAGTRLEDLLCPDFDTRPPCFVDLPPDLSADCASVPLPAMPRVVDDCDAEPAIEFEELRLDGPCADSYTLQRTWTATDLTGSSATATRLVEVSDSTPPVLSGVPADALVECGSVPAPAAVLAIDDCDPAPELELEEVELPGACPGEHELRRTWTATDRCGHVARATQRLQVVDTTPPVVEASDELLHCVWPPNHRFACFELDELSPGIAEGCSEPVSWRFVDCVSDQPDDGDGDGRTEDDCRVADDGRSVCVRAERSGTEPGGRHYRLVIVATDACGNESEPATIGRIGVPHDHSADVAACRRPTER